VFLKQFITVVCFAFLATSIFAQKDTLELKKLRKIKKGRIYNPLTPSKAAFYSAVFPGMGQAYNKKYWKTPIVWGALGTSIFFYLYNNKEFKRFRNAFKLRSRNLPDEFTVINDDGTTRETISIETLQRAQEQLKENRDLSLLSTVIIYVLQIVEASVNAHLLQFNTDDNLSFEPTFINDPIRIEAPKVGLTIKYNF
jgi:hypothetical protein